jgi:GNAT superfamily N-acetyltransferase
MWLSGKHRGSARRGDAIRLRNGSEARIRPVRRGDKALLAAMLEASSADSRYRRFHAPKPRLTTAELRYLTELDHRDHEALLAVDRRGIARGVARYVRVADGVGTAEVAILVRDDWQGSGLGPALLSRLADRARRMGIDHFRAVMQADNGRARQLFERLGPARVIEHHRGTVAIEIDLRRAAVPPSGVHEIGARMRPMTGITEATPSHRGGSHG